MKFGQGQKVIITGASTGIGRAIAIELAKGGAQVGLIARREELLLELVNEIQTLGGKAFYRVSDISERKETLIGISELINCMGGIDILIANAGVGAQQRSNPLMLKLKKK